jgi:hypothetical protein
LADAPVDDLLRIGETMDRKRLVERAKQLINKRSSPQGAGEDAGHSQTDGTGSENDGLVAAIMHEQREDQADAAPQADVGAGSPPRQGTNEPDARATP